MTGAEGDPVLDGVYLYPAAAGDEILAALRRAHRAFTRRFPGDDLAAFFKRSGALFHHFERAPAEPDPRPAEVPPEVEARVIGEYYDRHYRKWLDEPVPALENRTPREAAHLATLRPRLIALLKGFESGAERLRRDGRPAHDFSWMWQELGLESSERRRRR